MRITTAGTAGLFTGTEQRPLQIVRVTLVNDGPGMVRDPGTPVSVRVEGPGVTTPRPFGFPGIGTGEERTADVGVEVAAPCAEGSLRPVTVIAQAGTARAEARAEITAAVPGWTVWMVSHFHYDPVWWDTQGQYTETRLMLPDSSGKPPMVRAAFELVRLHLEMARQDRDYKFVLAEIDYLKPYFDTHPEDRATLRALLAEGRIEIAGGSYNEPNTNLTSAESTIRNAVYGVGYQRDVLGGDPASAWMLDVFGHDPGYPSLMAAAGLTSSAWARGPFHQWGPRNTVGSNERMQFPSEFEWISPDGNGLLTAYMPNHYGAGWAMEYLGDLEAAEREAYSQFASLKGVAATRNVLLPVGADHVIPSRWATQIHRDWNARYVWPKFVTALPREFFAAVRSDAGARGIAFTPQSRDMNPVYPGKDVSRIDIKQAQRAAETAVMDGERLATLAWLHGAEYPDAGLDKAWRQLVFGAHHDAITGTNSDQVYLDLLGGWREAYERGSAARREACRHLAGLADTRRPGAAPRPREEAEADRAVVVFNSLAHTRDGMATVTLRCPEPGTPWLRLADGAGDEVPALAEGVRRHPGGTLAEVTLTFRARAVPGLGYRTYWAGPAAAPSGGQGWAAAAGTAIGNDAFLVEADPARGGALSRVRDQRTGAELLRGDGPGGDGARGNELVLQEEYDYHPRWTEGPWLITPKGPGTGSAAIGATVRAERCPAGSRLVASFEMRSGPATTAAGTSSAALRVTQETLLWDGAERVEFRTHVDGQIGHDRLLRVRFPVNCPGGLPIYETSTAVIGRPFGHTGIDVGEHWYTLDNPAYTWFGLGSAARVLLSGGSGRPPDSQAVGVAEVIVPDGWGPGPGGDRQSRAARDLIAALARAGVTATCSRAAGPRYGALDLDSNLPDTRIALGGPEVNAFTAEVLDAAGPGYAKEIAERTASGGAVRMWVPSSGPRRDAFVPGADVRGARDLPVLIVAADDLAGAAAALAGDLGDAAVEAATLGGTAGDEVLAGQPVALLNRGTPGCIATGDGTLNISLMRSCSGWPAGVWIDQPQRTAPDGSGFGWQNWSHTFEYALASAAGTAGDWRDGGFTTAGQDYNHPLIAREEPVHPGRLPAAASLMEITTEAPGKVPLAALRAGGSVAASESERGAEPCSVRRAPGNTEAPGDVAPGDVAPGDVAPGDVVLGALKPRGNPRASGREPRPPREITVRVRETLGRPARLRLRVPGGVASARLTDLLEQRDAAPVVVHDGVAVAGIAPFGVMTASLTPTVVPGTGTPLAADSGGTANGARSAEPVPGTGQRFPGTAGAGGGTAGADGAEPAQPVFSRYWLHGKGPAPAGGMPVAVSISPVSLHGEREGEAAIEAGSLCQASPQHVGLPDGGSAVVRVTVAAGPEPVSGTVELDIPDGLPVTRSGAGGPLPERPAKYRSRRCAPAGASQAASAAGERSSARPGGRWETLRFDLPALGHAEWMLNVGPVTVPGRYFLAARITGPLGQVVEDVVPVAAGEPPAPAWRAPLEDLLAGVGAQQRATAAELDVAPLTGGISLPPGGSGELAVRLTNRTRSQIRGEAQLLSPFGSWELTGPWTQGFALDPGEETAVRYLLAAALNARPGGRWWALVKIMYFGRLRYTEAVPLSISVTGGN